MNTTKLSNKELIKQVSTEVEDLNLRKQLIDALMEREETKNHRWNTQPNMAVHPDAIPSNVRLKKWANAIGGAVFFFLVLSKYNDTPESATSHSFFWLMTILVPVIFLLQHIHLSNISKWQNRGRKPARRWWGIGKLFG